VLAGTSIVSAVEVAIAQAASPTVVLIGTPWTVLMLLFWVVLGVVAVHGGAAYRRVRNAAWLGRLPGRLGALPTEDRGSYDRPSGFKVARLTADPGTGEGRFLGLTLGGAYAADDLAGCEVLAGSISPPRRWGRRRVPEPHDPPDLACTCGFHAFRDRAEALELLATRPPVSRMFGPVLLEVDLAGTVVEFDRGYRASQQRVLGVHVPRWCLPCARGGRGRPAVRLAGIAGADLERACRSDLPDQPSLYRYALAAHHLEVVRRLEGRAALRPVCEDHTPVVAPPDPERAPSTVVLELADLAAGLGTEVRWLDDEVFALRRFLEAVSWPPPPRGSIVA
jgi:hypothetical protein